jgi:hypothetical protein
MSKQATVTEFVLSAEGPVTIAEVAEATGVPVAETKVYLGRAVKRGQLTAQGDGVYVIAVESEELELENLPRVVEGVIAQEGIPSGDGRMLERGAISWDGVLPIPLIFDIQEGDHSAPVVGSVVEVDRRGDDIWARAHLSQSDDEDVQRWTARVEELFNEGAVGVSIMLDSDVHEIRVKKELVQETIEDLEAEADDDSAEEAIEDLEKAPTEGDRVVVYSFAADDYLDVTTSGRLRHVAVVDTAALLTEPEKRMAIAASGALIDAKWSGFGSYFDDPQFGDPSTDSRLRYDPATGQWSCPPTRKDDRVFGHIAPWGYCLRGRPDRCVTPPDGDVETFMRAYAPAAGGKRTGVICVGGGHAKTGAGPAEATRYYDNTGRAVADVRVGRDQYGIWFSGMVRPGASAEDLYTFEASDVSGHWEPDQSGRFRLCGLPSVNVGGFAKGLYTYSEVMQGLAASATLEDCGCEDVPTVTTSLDARLDRIEIALGALYAAHLGEQFSDD